MTLTAVDNDPFADAPAPQDAAPATPTFKLVPVNHDPFAPAAKNVPEPPTNQSGLDAAVDGFNNGVTFNQAQPIMDRVGAASAALQGTGNYGDNLKQLQAESEKEILADKEQHPWLYGGGFVPGAVVGTMMGGKVLGAAADALLPESASNAITAGANAFPKTAATLGAAGSGAGAGALYAAGQNETTPSDPTSVGGSAAIGAAAGPVGLGVAKVASPIIKSGAQKLMQLLGVDGTTAASTAAGNAADPLAPQFRRPPPVTEPPTAGVAGTSDPLGAGMPPAGAQNAPAYGILDDNDMALRTGAKGFPLSPGQESQNVLQQRNEQVALKNGSPAMLALQNAQDQSAKGTLLSGLGPNQDLTTAGLGNRVNQEASNMADLLRERYGQLKTTENNAWNGARAMGENGESLQISGPSIQGDLVGGIQNMLHGEGYEMGDIPALDAHLEKLKSLAPTVKTTTTTPGMYSPTKETTQEVTPADINGLVKWKQGLNRIAGNSIVTAPADSRLMTLVGKQYDGYMTNLADDAIVGGNPDQLQAFQDAKLSTIDRANFGDQDTIMSRILENKTLNGSDAANILLGSGKLAGSQGDNGLFIPESIAKMGDLAPQYIQSARNGMQAIVGKAGLEYGLPNPLNPQDTMINTNGMYKALGNLLQQPDTLNALYTPEEVAGMQDLYGKLRLASKFQPGAVNNSSTGVAMADFYNSMADVANHPFFKIPVSGAAAAAATASAGPMAGAGAAAAPSLMSKWLSQKALDAVTGDVESSVMKKLAPEAIKQFDGQKVFYGGALGGASLDPLGEGFKNLNALQPTTQQQGSNP